MKFRNLGMYYDDVDELGAGAGQEQGATEQQEEEQQQEEQEQQEELPKTYTQEEVDALIKKEAQREADKVRTKAAKEKREAELAAMNEADRRAAELADKEAALLSEKEAFAREKMINNTTKLLVSESLPVEFNELLAGKDEETTKNNVTNFKTKFNAAVQAEVDRRFKDSGSNPKKLGKPIGKYSREDLSKLSDADFFALKSKGQI